MRRRLIATALLTTALFPAIVSPAPAGAQDDLPGIAFPTSAEREYLLCITKLLGVSAKPLSEVRLFNDHVAANCGAPPPWLLPLSDRTTEFVASGNGDRMERVAEDLRRNLNNALGAGRVTADTDWDLGDLVPKQIISTAGVSYHQLVRSDGSIIITRTLSKGKQRKKGVAAQLKVVDLGVEAGSSDSTSAGLVWQLDSPQAISDYLATTRRTLDRLSVVAASLYAGVGADCEASKDPSDALLCEQRADLFTQAVLDAPVNELDAIATDVIDTSSAGLQIRGSAGILSGLVAELRVGVGGVGSVSTIRSLRRPGTIDIKVALTGSVDLDGKVIDVASNGAAASPIAPLFESFSDVIGQFGATTAASGSILPSAGITAHLVDCETSCRLDSVDVEADLLQQAGLVQQDGPFSLDQPADLAQPAADGLGALLDRGATASQVASKLLSFVYVDSRSRTPDADGPASRVSLRLHIPTSVDVEAALTRALDESSAEAWASLVDVLLSAAPRLEIGLYSGVRYRTEDAFWISAGSWSTDLLAPDRWIGSENAGAFTDLRLTGYFGVGPTPDASATPDLDECRARAAAAGPSIPVSSTTTSFAATCFLLALRADHDVALASAFTDPRGADPTMMEAWSDPLIFEVGADRLAPVDCRTDDLTCWFRWRDDEALALRLSMSQLSDPTYTGPPRYVVNDAVRYP